MSKTGVLLPVFCTPIRPPSSASPPTHPPRPPSVMMFTALIAAAILAAPALAAPLLEARQAACAAGPHCPAGSGDVSVNSVGVVPTGTQWVVYDDAIDDPAITYDYIGETAVPWTTLTNQGLETYNRTYSYTGVDGEVFITLPGTTKVSSSGPSSRASTLWSDTPSA